MDKSQIVSMIAEKSGISTENVEKVLTALQDVAKNELSSHFGGAGNGLGSLGNLGGMAGILGFLHKDGAKTEPDKDNNS